MTLKVGDRVSRQMAQAHIYGTVAEVPPGLNFVWVRPDGSERESAWLLDDLLVRALRGPSFQNPEQKDLL